VEQKSFVRKHFFIDRNFQGRYMLTFLVPMLVLLIFMIFTLYIASQAIINTTTRIIKRDIESKIALELQDQTVPSVAQYESVVNNITKYIRSFSSNKEFKRDLLNSLLWVFGIGVFLVIIQLVMLTIFYSHKVAGPVYRFERVCNDMIKGQYTDEIRLRKGDEMQHLAGLFNDALKATRERLIQLRDSSSDEKRKEIISSLEIEIKQ
jgi:nitrogen fixation/metabolism regulation signal transduction histidine kinase